MSRTILKQLCAIRVTEDEKYVFTHWSKVGPVKPPLIGRGVSWGQQITVRLAHFFRKTNN